jgi:hypothetical protein
VREVTIRRKEQWKSSEGSHVKKEGAGEIQYRKPMSKGRSDGGRGGRQAGTHTHNTLGTRPVKRRRGHSSQGAGPKDNIESQLP